MLQGSLCRFLLFFVVSGWQKTPRLAFVVLDLEVKGGLKCGTQARNLEAAAGSSLQPGDSPSQSRRNARTTHVVVHSFHLPINQQKARKAISSVPALIGDLQPPQRSKQI